MSRKILGTVFAISLAALLVAGVVAIAGKMSFQAHARERAALPPERAEAYREALLSSLRTTPYMVAPREDVAERIVSVALGPDASREEVNAAVDKYYEDFYTRNNKVSRPNPLARLGRMKQLEIAELQQAQGIDVSTALTGTPEVLTVMLNFTGVETYTTSDPVVFAGACLTDTSVYSSGFEVVIEGPEFNEIPDPSTVGDNWLGWIPTTTHTGGFSQAFYEQLMFSTTGYTGTWRGDLANPWDGSMGFDFSGVSFLNYYLEQSRGVYAPQGAVVELDSPYAESQFGAESCFGGFNAYNGSVSRVATHAADLINTQYPGASTGSNASFSWADWDQEDVFDYDNDGNFHEPDGYVDHFFLIEAGIGEHGGGGPIQEFAIWAHSSDVNPGDITSGPAGNKIGGYQVMTDTNHPLGGVWVLNYTISDEGSGLGVLVHEYGHDIGLPDNYAYDTSGPNPGLWDLMASGSWNGELASMRPSNMTIWDKAEDYLGWNAPVDIDIATTSAIGEENAQVFMVGQQSKPPQGTVDGLRINLPTLVKTASVTPYDSNMWWSDLGDDRNESIAQMFTPISTETITITTQIAYAIEVDFDYMAFEFSTDDGNTWNPLPVYSDTMEITVYGDMSGNNPGLDPVLNGFSGGWITATATITEGQHGGADTWFRFRYFTDAGFQEEGIYLDNISIDGSASGNIFYDDAESGDSWTHISEGVNGTAPWLIFDGVISGDSYYLVEWRNAGEEPGANGNSDTATAFDTAGFDLGLNRSYWVSELTPQSDVVRSPFFMNTPGMLVWYVNGLYQANGIDSTLFDDPSWGAKGRVLEADANPDPYFVSDVGGLRSVGERRSAFDGAYTLNDRPAFDLHSNLNQTPTDSVTTIPAAPAKPVFRDRIGTVPGVSGSFFIDYDAGAVLPSVDQVPYATYWDIFGDLGNPGLNAFGVNLEIVEQAPDGSWAKIKFWLDDDTVFLDSKASTTMVTGTDSITYTVNLKDASGSRYNDSHQHIYDAGMLISLPDAANLISSSVSLSGNGTVIYGSSALAAAQAMGYNASTEASAGGYLFWSGQLGGNRIGEPDAILEYAVTLEPGCIASTADLFVGQEMITDTFRNGGAPFLWPKNNLYTEDLPTACTPQIFLPSVFASP